MKDVASLGLMNRGTIPMRMSRLPFYFILLCSVIAHSALGHPADQSEMRVRPKPHQLEIRLTFNILTLTRFTGIDTDGDKKISVAELTAAQPRISTYLNQHIHVEINRQKAMLGSGVRFEPVWPDAALTPPMSEIEYAARNVDVTFVQTIEGKVLEDPAVEAPEFVHMRTISPEAAPAVVVDAHQLLAVIGRDVLALLLPGVEDLLPEVQGPVEGPPVTRRMGVLSSRPTQTAATKPPV